MVALVPPPVSNMSRRPTPTPAQPAGNMKHCKTVSSLTPGMVTVPRISRRRCNAKVPVTISHSFVSLGWWMVMSDDEQGYAPAAYLEPVEGGVRQAVEQAMDSSETFEGVSELLVYLEICSMYSSKNVCISKLLRLIAVSCYIECMYDIPWNNSPGDVFSHFVH